MIYKLKGIPSVIGEPCASIDLLGDFLWSACWILVVVNILATACSLWSAFPRHSARFAFEQSVLWLLHSLSILVKNRGNVSNRCTSSVVVLDVLCKQVWICYSERERLPQRIWDPAGNQTLGFPNTACMLLPLSHWTHDRGVEASLLKQHRLRAPAVPLPLMVDYTLPMVHVSREPLRMGLCIWVNWLYKHIA